MAPARSNGHPVDVTVDDDGDSATTAVTDFKSLVGAGYKIITGTADSGIATELAPLAAQNQVLYISGAAAADQITGANKYAFRAACRHTRTFRRPSPTSRARGRARTSSSSPKTTPSASRT